MAQQDSDHQLARRFPLLGPFRVDVPLPAGTGARVLAPPVQGAHFMGLPREVPARAGALKNGR